MAGFSIEPDVAKESSSTLGDAADRLEAAATALTQALAAAGQCWGADESGQEFAKDYVPGSEGAVKAFASLAEGLRAMRGSVVDAMTAYETIEDGSARTFSRGV